MEQPDSPFFMSHPDKNQTFSELTFDEVFVEEEELPTQPFSEAIRSVLHDEQQLQQDELTRNASHFDLLREALKEGNIDQLKCMLQMINLLFLDEHIDPGDLAFDMQQILQWLASNDSDDQINITLSDDSYLRITMAGSKKENGEPSFFFSNPDIQKQFQAISSQQG